MKQLILIIALFTFPICVYSQKNIKIEASVNKNFGEKFYQTGFTIDVPIETMLKDNVSSVLIGLKYSRKQNMTTGQKPIREYEVPKTSSCFVCLSAESKHFVMRAKQYKFDYLQVPLEYKRYFNHRKEFLFKFGTYLGYAINGQVSNFEFENGIIGFMVQKHF